MKAAVHTRYGPPEVVHVVEVPTPTAKDSPDRTYSPSDILEAYRYVETGQKVGNVVITVEQED